jgi:hypothetical protein
VELRYNSLLIIGAGHPGAKGLAGLNGAQGPQGPPGDKGATGPRGNNCHTSNCRQKTLGGRKK